MAEKFRKADWFISRARNGTPEWETARNMIRALHYTHRAPAVGNYVYGLFHRDAPERLMGVAWWKVPLPNARKSAAKLFGFNPHAKKTVLDLSRLVIHPDAPTNAASFLIGRSVQEITDDGVFPILTTSADSFRDHTGQIYKATNWDYLGLGKRRERVWVDPATGEQVSKAQGQGHNYTVAEMEEAGYVTAGWSQRHRFAQCVWDEGWK